jgi:hypothetical protein
MKITELELSLERGNSGEYEHEGYFDTIDDLIRYLKKLKKQEKDNEGDDWK